MVHATDGGSTICQSHGLAAKRVEAAITKLDFEEYANAHTKNISKLMVHSLKRVSGFSYLYICVFWVRDFLFRRLQLSSLQWLNEAMVISRCWLNLEVDLARLKERLAELEASQESLNKAVFELGKEKRDALTELEKAKVDLSTKDGDIKATVGARDNAVKEISISWARLRVPGWRLCQSIKLLRLLKTTTFDSSTLASRRFRNKLRRDTLKLIFLLFCRMMTLSPLMMMEGRVMAAIRQMTPLLNFYSFYEQLVYRACILVLLFCCFKQFGLVF